MWLASQTSWLFSGQRPNEGRLERVPDEAERRGRQAGRLFLRRHLRPLARKKVTPSAPASSL